MRIILGQLARVAGAFVLLYAVLTGVALLAVPSDRESRMDSGLAGDTIYSSAPRYIYFNRTRLMTPDQKVVIVGASNADVGLRPEKIQAEVPCAVVNGLTIGNMNITEMRQAVDLVHAVQAPAERRRDTFVFGIWYGDFGDGKDRYQGPSHANAETDLEVELYRYGFYGRTPDGPAPRLPVSLLRLQGIVLRPFHVAELVMRRITSQVRQTFFMRTRYLSDAEREAKVVGPAERQDALTYWDGQLGGHKDLSAEQFAQFRALIDGLLRADERVVVVDLPIPRWHERASPYVASYRARLAEILRAFQGAPGFSAVAMPDLGPDDGFSDEVHPKPHLAALWAARVGTAVGDAACHHTITSASR